MTTTQSPPIPNWPLDLTATTTGRRWSLRRWMLVVGAVTLLFSICAVLAGSLALARLTQTRAVVLDQIQPAFQASQDLSIALLDQETGVRGYSVAGHQAFLDRYVQGIEAEEQAVEKMRSYAAAGSIELLADDVDRVQQRARSWRSGYADPTVASIGAFGQSNPIDPEVGRAEFDAVRSALLTLQNDLNVEQADATEQLREAADFLRLVFVAIAIGLAALIIAVGVWLRRAVTGPLSELATEVRQVLGGDAHREVEGRGPSEIVELAGDVDAMRRHILDELDALELAHRRLDEQARDLERSNRDLEQFAYVASHDLQEPLRKISSFCQLLQRRYGGQLDERGESYILFAVDGARRMQQLINDLLAFSRVGRLTSGFDSVDLNAAAAAALAQLSTVSEEAGARITVGELPTVHGEASLLVQLIANLIGNALKFSRPGTPPEVTIEAQPQQDGDGWEICVTDNGIGIEPEYADKVFVIFQRLHSREDYPGTGIGLAMAKKIVEYHGGRIWFDHDRDPDRGRGATVRFTLPSEVSQVGGRGNAEQHEHTDAKQIQEPAQ